MPNLLSGIVQGLGQGILGSESSTLFVLFLAVAGFVIFLNWLRNPPFDVTRHIERPPLDHKPTRALPPAGEYVKWEGEKDKEKDRVPWS